MGALGNILWHIPFLGFLNALFVFLLGLLLTALVITAPNRSWPFTIRKIPFTSIFLRHGSKFRN